MFKLWDKEKGEFIRKGDYSKFYIDYLGCIWKFTTKEDPDFPPYDKEKVPFCLLDVSTKFIKVDAIGLKDREGNEIYEGHVCSQLFNPYNQAEEKVRETGIIKRSPTQGVLVGNKPIWVHDVKILVHSFEHEGKKILEGLKWK